MKIKPSIISPVILISALFAFACTQNKNEITRPNVLFIIADDLRPELGCYGQDHIISPNIDSLATQGIVFKNAHVQQAVCSASRASFMAGVNPYSIGVNYPYSKYFVEEWLPEHDDLTTWFYKNGYYTLNIGKIHHTYPGNPIDTLSEESFLPDVWRYALSKNREPVDMRYFIDKKSKNTAAYEFADAPDEEYKDVLSTRKAIEALHRISKQDKPFFMALGYLKPHLPFVAPKRYWDMYEGVDIQLSEYSKATQGAPEYARNKTHGEMVTHTIHDPESGEYLLNEYEVNDKYALNLRRAYYSCVSFVDDQVGLVLKELKQLGMDKNTIVVFIGDHGWHLGDNACWGKSTNFEMSTRAPMIIYDPKSGTSGETEALVEFTDIYPTLADLAGLEIPDFVEGTSMKLLMNDLDRDWKSAAFSRFPRGPLMGNTMRTENFRYTEWVNTKTGVIDAIELYRYKGHEPETLNLAGEKKYAALLEQFAQMLKDGFKGALPNGIVNNSNNQRVDFSSGWGPEITVSAKRRLDLEREKN